MIYLLRGLLFILMGIFLLLNGGSAYSLDDLTLYFSLFLTADAGILLFIRRRVHVFEALFDLVLVVCFWAGLIDSVGLMIQAAGAWFVASGIAHLAQPRRPGVTAFLVLCVGVVMILFGAILFFRSGLETAGFMGMLGMFLLLPGVVMVIGGLIGRSRAG